VVVVRCEVVNKCNEHIHLLLSVTSMSIYYICCSCSKFSTGGSIDLAFLGEVFASSLLSLFVSGSY
jgi:hypothetical protein